jgi:hypothetical protein
MIDESRKKILAAEVKIKDLQSKLKEKNAEVEVLKEMVKSSNMQAKAKDIDI